MLKHTLLCILLLTIGAAPVENAKPQAAGFGVFDVIVDSGDRPLGAYQVDLVLNGATLVGIEGASDKSFNKPPYYDPAAMMKNHVILAAIAQGEQLSSGQVRVARLHLRIDGETKFEGKLIVAGNEKGERIEAKVGIEQGESK